MTNLKKSILFIEDEEELLITVGNLLSDKGFDVICVKTGEEAISYLTDNKPDLLLIDLKLPGMDGFDIMKEVRSKESIASIPMVVLTAYNDLNAMMHAKKSGAADYITKPFDFEYLITTVSNILFTKK